LTRRLFRRIGRVSAKHLDARESHPGADTIRAIDARSSLPDEESNEYNEARVYFGGQVSDLYRRLEDDAAARYGADYDVDAGRGRFMARLAERAQAGESESPGETSANRRSPRRFTLTLGSRSLRVEIGIERSAGLEAPERPAAMTKATSRTRPGSERPLLPRGSVREQQQRGSRDWGAQDRDNPSTAFWDILDSAEREALRSVASWRTFAAGARIMEEGERADYVIVILGGQVEIRIDENGGEQAVGVRGLGQLVGERAALSVSVRSATVVALEMVWALVVQTKDFAAFISAHPRVLGIVQNQKYHRRAIGAPGYEHDDDSGDSRSGLGSGADVVVQPTEDYSAGNRRKRPRTLNGENCTIFLTDVVAFGAHIRSDNDRVLIRDALFKMTQNALQGFPDAQSEDRGDGLLTVVPQSTSTARVLDRFLKELPAALERHNSTQRESAQFKLRLAVNVGPVVSHMGGVSGEAIIVAARLVEAPSFKQILAETNASMGVIASPFVYETVIRHGPDPRDVASYSQVPVEVKESDTTAWMKLFSHGRLLSPVLEAR
jgi:CRP-like cAMP-binding protein